jgi:hypothetical protein
MNTNQTVTGEGNAPRELTGTIAREFIQCADKNGRTGDFLATNAKRQVSPTFDNLGDLYTWANKNDWMPEGGARVYRPRGEAIETYMAEKYPNLI